MIIEDILMLVPGSPVLSALAWILALSFILYAARQPVHRALEALGKTLYGGLRVAARSATLAEKRLAARNREVLLAAGREQAERMVEREFERIDTAVQRDLGSLPTLQRKLGESVKRIEHDYQTAADVPAAPDAWVSALDAVANIPSRGDSMVATVLEDIRRSMERSQEQAVDAYREEGRKRHRLLARMAPYWRKISRSVEQSDQRIERLLERSQAVDRHMAEYRNIVKGSPKVEQTLSSSSMTQFWIAGLVLAIAIGGAMINFHLIARPMQEMVGGSSHIMGYRVADIAALVIILVETSLGVFLMESLHITRLFPMIGALDDRIRIRIAWFAFGLLFTLASIEAGLAYMREILAHDDAALVASLTGQAGDAAGNPYGWITTASQMGMGFILPFALTLVAIPLEAFIHASRTVLGVILALALRATAGLLRLLGDLSRRLAAALAALYDILIFGPLWLERVIAARGKSTEENASNESAMTLSVTPTDTQKGAAR